MDVKNVYRQNYDDLSKVGRRGHHGRRKTEEEAAAQKPEQVKDEVTISAEAKEAAKAQESGKIDPFKELKANTTQKLEELMRSIENKYNTDVDAIKNSAGYQKALEDLASGKGVKTTANGDSIYYAEKEEGVPEYVIFNGQIFLKSEGEGYWAYNNGQGDIPKDIEIKKPGEGEEGYGASDLSKKDTTGKALVDFVKSQAKDDNDWQKMLKQLTATDDDTDWLAKYLVRRWGQDYNWLLADGGKTGSDSDVEKVTAED